VLDKPQVRSRAAGEGREPTEAAAYFKETGPASVRHYDGASLPAGARLEGPAIVHEPTTTVVVYPGSVATVTPLGNYLLELTEVEAPTALQEATA
jgi:N-methylhydantoinase A